MIPVGVLFFGILFVSFLSVYSLARCGNKEDEQNEEARKKLLEKEERDIELDGNE